MPRRVTNRVRARSRPFETLEAVLVVLRRVLDRRQPRLAPLRPDLGFGLQIERRVVERPDPDLDERVAGIRGVENTRAATRTESAAVVVRDLAAELERFDGP